MSYNAAITCVRRICLLALHCDGGMLIGQLAAGACVPVVDDGNSSTLYVCFNECSQAGVTSH